MANYRTNQFSYSFTVPVHLYMSVSFGSSGAPTIVSNTGMGITSISRVSAGLYDITLAQPYASLLSMQVIMKVSSGIPAGPVVAIVSEAVSSTGVIRIRFTDYAGVTADPASGEVAFMDICVKNTSARN